MKANSVLKSVLAITAMFLIVSFAANAQVTAPQTTTAPTTSTAATKKAVQGAQQRLQVLGYEPGSADGVMGSRTVIALKKFQSDHGLSVTGVLDQKTLDALSAKDAKEEQKTPTGQGKKTTSPVQKGAPPTDTSITMPLKQHYADKDYHYTCHPTLESQKQLKLTTFGGEMELGEQKEMPSDSFTITIQDPPSTWYCTKNHDR
jgi:peptidoglycan hydrolase-like protein with peptidoglycan-binding domain